MKTTLKKALCLLLALTCVLAFAGCTSTEDDGETKKENGKEEATEVVENFMDALIGLNFEEAASYIDDESVLDDMPFKNPDDIIDMLVAESPEMAPYADDFKPMLDTMLNKITDKMEYTIGDAEKDGDDYKVSVTLTMPDEESMDFETVMANLFTEEELNNMLMDLFSSGKISLESSEEEMMKVVVTEVVAKATVAIEDMDVQTTTEEKEFVVTKVDGEWLIDAENSEIN